MIFFWLGLLLLFIILEAATVALTCIWFALGSLAALISAAIAPDLWWLQILWFIVVSAVSLIATRPLVRKHLNTKKAPTNADRVLDMEGVVREKIDNLSAAGIVFVDGKLWTARSENGETIEKDTLVTIHRIEGVKLIVSPARAENPDATEAGVSGY